MLLGGFCSSVLRIKIGVGPRPCGETRVPWQEEAGRDAAVWRMLW